MLASAIVALAKMHVFTKSASTDVAQANVALAALGVRKCRACKFTFSQCSVSNLALASLALATSA